MTLAGASASAATLPADVADSASSSRAAVGPLTWSDEFDGSSLDLTRWSYRATGPREDGILTPDAVSVGNGALTIKTYTEDGKHYSGMVSTQKHDSDGFEQAYGYFEARVKFNDAPGQWSAFWLQSPTIGGTLGDPATAGVEMDVVEHRARCVTAPLPTPPATCAADGDISDRTQRALIWDGYGADRKATVRLSDPLAGLTNDSWHTWGLRWTPTDVTFYYDGAAIWSSTGPISRRSQYVILSSEVSRLFAGAIPAGGYGSRATSTTNMQVDYVRVWGAAPAPAAPASPRDRTPPRATLSGRTSQRLGSTVRVVISCPDESCRATMTGSVRVPQLGRTRARTYTTTATATLARGTKVAVRLRLPDRARAAITRALQAHRRIVVKLGVRVSDGAGNVGVGTRRVTLKR
jgi:beta-glucanase (GH16 family)